MASLAAASVLAASGDRVHVSGSRLMLGDEEVFLLGGNYCMKAPPYFPPVHQVTADAQAMAEGAATIQIPGAQVRAVVRLCALFEAAQPDAAYAVDAAWEVRLNETIEAFASAGVYVNLDIHQDAFSSSGGGEGFPVWFAHYMQSHGNPEGRPYLVSPTHPLQRLQGLAGWIMSLLTYLGVPGIPRVPSAVAGDDDPWRAYSLETDAGDPRRMNIGNPSMRLNNNDGAWSEGVLFVTRQLQNFAYRLYRSWGPGGEADRAALFGPYVAHVKSLARAWEGHWNVVSVELINEPPPGGGDHWPGGAWPWLWPYELLGARRDLWAWEAAVLLELEAEGLRAPICVSDIGNAVCGLGSGMMSLFCTPLLAPQIEPSTRAVLARRGAADGLIFSVHDYCSVFDCSSLDDLLAASRAFADDALGGAPVTLSEWFHWHHDENAMELAAAVAANVSMATFWHYADTNYTHTQGWFRYEEGVPEPISAATDGDLDGFAAYQATVDAGSSWGGDITGSRGGKTGVLQLVPDYVDRA